MFLSTFNLLISTVLCVRFFCQKKSHTHLYQQWRFRREFEGIQKGKCEGITPGKSVTVCGYVITVFYAIGSVCQSCYRTQSRFLPISSSVIFA